MYRVLVALLSAVDAVVAAVVGLAAVFAPLAVVWAFGLDGGASWSALWPTGATVWQLGHLVPMQIELPADYLSLAGIDASAASFPLTLAPLAFAAFTAIFALRSGARAARAAAWITGVLTGTLVFGAATVGVWMLGANPIARPDAVAAIAIPTALYLACALAGAVVAAWREGDEGIVDRIRAAVEDRPEPWGAVPGLVVRGSVIVLAGLVGAAAALLGGALLWNAADIIALYETGHATALGATMLTLGQIAYLPTLIVWALSWISGPGFALGAGTAVSPAGTQLGVVPGIPVLGVIPESSTPWLLLVLLVPVGVAVLAGTRLRRPLHEDAHAVARLVAILAIALVCALAAAGLAVAASGSLGPGRLADTGPQPGPLALAVGVEVLVGLAIGLFAPSPRRRARDSAGWVAADDTPAVTTVAAGAATTGPSDADERSRPTPLPPVD